MVTKNTRHKGRTLDLAGLTVALAEAAGFTYLQHVVALHAAIRDGDLVARPSFWQRTQTQKATARGEAAHLVVHEDLCVFSAGPTCGSSARLKGFRGQPKRSSGTLPGVGASVRSEPEGPDSTSASDLASL